MSRRGVIRAALAAALVAVDAHASSPMLGSGLLPQPPSLLDGVLGTTPAPMRDEPPLDATPPPDCRPGSRPAPGIDGRVVGGPESAPGYWCNIVEVGHEGASGGYKVERYVDPAGHVCAYYDTTLLFPLNALTLSAQPTGTAVLDMSDPAHPRRTATLLTPAMQSPHESLLVNQRRGLLAAVMGTPVTAPGFIDIYDLKQDCRRPVLESSTPVGLLGHESGWSPDGRTFYATSVATGQITAVDVSNPRVPVILWVGLYPSHGTTISDDGDRAYVAARNVGLIILDTSEIQQRKPLPQVREVSRLDWKSRTIPQVAIPVRIRGKPYLVEVDEFSTDASGSRTSNGPVVGAARIIDISDEKAPRVISQLRLAVDQPANRTAIANDPGARSSLQGHAAHYCNVPRERDPGIVACSFIASGLRVFDIHDPYHPTQIAYFVAPPGGFMGTRDTRNGTSDWAMSKPAFDPARHEVWYSDGNSGFYTLKLTNDTWPQEGS
jgi:hypothetical protein